MTNTANALIALAVFLIYIMVKKLLTCREKRGTIDNGYLIFRRVIV